MARVSSAQMTDKNPLEWVEGATRARAARENVAAQVTDLIRSADLTGSPDFVVLRIRNYSEAQKAGDRAAERAALMEMAVAAAATAAAIDLTLPAAA